ncbi:hypothetical protein [Aestuariivirga sp.]|uniref:hypothetical protein n=1 Tax=Aestuariivirga sp. TaxID=2650926 RepID=UPI003BAAF5AD
MTDYEEIVSAIRGGNPALALIKIEPLLASAPENAELLALKGLALAVTGRPAEAIECVRRAIGSASTPAQKLKYAGNLARLLAQAGRWRELAALAGPGLPSPSLVDDVNFDAASFENLSLALLGAGEHDYVASFLSPVLDRPGASWELEHIWLRAADRATFFADILSRAGSPSYRWSNKPEAIAFACAAAIHLKRREEAERLFERYLESAPAYVSRREDTQIISIAMISPDPSLQTLTEPAVQQHFSANFPSQLKALRPDRYRFLSVFVGSPPRSLAGEIGPNEVALTLNNCVNGENLKRGDLRRVEGHEMALGFPVVNAAANAVRCTRQETADLLRGIDNLVVPKIMHFKLDHALFPAVRAHINDLFVYPVILRTVGEQEATHLHLATNNAELGAALSELLARGEKDIYVIDYIKLTHRKNMHRRMRAAFVGGVPTLMRADYDSYWIVKGRKTESIQATYKQDRALLEHADAILRHPEQLGDGVWTALAEIGKRIPLDVFGLDFDVDEQGRIVFFESNATMNLLSNAPPEIDYPAEAQQAFLDRLDSLLLKRAGVTFQ